jgi:hypothetical protein
MRREAAKVGEPHRHALPLPLPSISRIRSHTSTKSFSCSKAARNSGVENGATFGSLICCMTAHLLALTVWQFDRYPLLSFNHHAEVAALTPKQQGRWLDRAEKSGLSVKLSIGRTQAA